jgi:hypothetical protein
VSASSSDSEGDEEKDKDGGGAWLDLQVVTNFFGLLGFAQTMPPFHVTAWMMKWVRDICHHGRMRRNIYCIFSCRPALNLILLREMLSGLLRMGIQSYLCGWKLNELLINPICLLNLLFN